MAAFVKVEEQIGGEREGKEREGREGWGGCSSLPHEKEVLPITNGISKQISLRI